MFLRTPDVVKTCATMATSPNQLGIEGRSSDAICRWTDGCVILPVFSLVSKIEVFSSSKETHFCLFYKGFSSFLWSYLYCLLVFISLRTPWAWSMGKGQQPRS